MRSQHDLTCQIPMDRFVGQVRCECSDSNLAGCHHYKERACSLQYSMTARIRYTCSRLPPNIAYLLQMRKRLPGPCMDIGYHLTARHDHIPILILGVSSRSQTYLAKISISQPLRLAKKQFVCQKPFESCRRSRTLRIYPNCYMQILFLENGVEMRSCFRSLSVSCMAVLYRVYNAGKFNCKGWYKMKWNSDCEKMYDLRPRDRRIILMTPRWAGDFLSRWEKHLQGFELVVYEKASTSLHNFTSHTSKCPFSRVSSHVESEDVAAPRRCVDTH